MLKYSDKSANKMPKTSNLLGTICVAPLKL
jgi:hypothetical protein